MASTSNRIFVSLGVSKAGGGLPALPGAITASERMAAWAEGQGYSTLLLHDAKNPVTIALLKQEISAAIEAVTQQTPLQRLVVFFAGHGAAHGIFDQFWLLNNWYTDLSEAIKVAAFQRVLERYGPKQVAMIGDACQEVSPHFIDLVGSAVLNRPDEEPIAYELDRFFAADAGKQAFMIKAQGDQKSFCLFTEVLLDALEGEAPDTYYELLPDGKGITSQTLAQYLNQNLAREAGKYNVQMTPRTVPGFSTDRVYLLVPQQPEAPRARRRTRRASAGADADAGDAGTAAGATAGAANEYESAPPPAERPATTPSLGDLIERASRRNPSARYIKRQVEQIVSAHARATKKPRLINPSIGLPRARVSKSTLPATAHNKKALAATLARVAEFKAFVQEAETAAAVPLPIEAGQAAVNSAVILTGPNLVKTNQATTHATEHLEVAASFADVERINTLPEAYSIQLAISPNDTATAAWSDVVINLPDNRLIAVCAVQGYAAALHLGTAAPASLFHRPINDAPAYDGRHEITLLAHAQTGLLDLAAAQKAAVTLQQHPHHTLALGCLLAQYYDAIRDITGLRKLAAHYALNHLPVPLDIILYGGGVISEYDGKLYANIPATSKAVLTDVGTATIPATGQTTPAPSLPAATPAFTEHPIAGRIPWLRQTWDAIDTAQYDDNATQWRNRAINAMRFLTAGIFTTATPDGRQAFLELASINVNTNQREPLAVGAALTSNSAESDA